MTSSSYVPAWVADLFNYHLDKHERRTQVLRLSIGGISMLRGVPQALQVLAASEGGIEDAELRIKRAERDGALAQRELDHDFPLLHEQAVIALWSELESLVRSFVAHLLANDPEAWQCEAVKKLRVRLGDYINLEMLDRCLWVTDLIDQELSGPLRSGVTRFENLLQPFKLSGSLDAECQKALFELSQVRNVLVHRSGVVDRKLLDSCPWLGLKTGDHIQITHKMWRSYDDAVGAYILELVRRTRAYFGLPRDNDPAVERDGAQG